MESNEGFQIADFRFHNVRTIGATLFFNVDLTIAALAERGRGRWASRELPAMGLFGFAIGDE